MCNAQMSVSVAADFNKIMQAITVRAAVYVGENGWRLKEKLDGNDFTTTRLIARRVRYFDEIAKFERLAVMCLHGGG